MSFKTYTFKKTAVLTAVFCFMWSTKLVATNTPGLSEGALEVVKKKAINLLMQSQKKQALVVLSEYISRENNKNLVKAARDFRLKIAKKFLTKEAQEFYEMSLNLTVENPKASKKNNEDCLIKDPENLDCIIQKIRLLCRDRKGPLKVEDFQLAEKYFDAGEIDWVKISCEKNSSDFKTYNFFK